MSGAALAKFITSLGAAPDRQAGFDALGTLVDEALGTRLFTVMVLDRPRAVASRAWTNMPDAYPASGEKPIEPNDWLAGIQRGESFVRNSIDEIAEVFPDWELIRSLGCHSVLNMPVRARGQIVGTLNLLDGPGHFTRDRVAACEAILRLPGTACFLL
ncbi:hypothetical protein ATO6_15925 [Oceanicola sp. 22II-s10i]|uniref:GAF domain-containing protein n=1 Tax=Oceanicola sp. 22II-s10i TaxID=1317116 RepID=UPI000B5221A6|nr:GAF domain-containing protein [Oceanicola sp. 22II-s10i]OWU83903.1 hypothetical protein ATO6_15925 [Oceanicola sp. 22II-s10i]